MWCPLVRFVSNGECNMEDCFANAMKHWYGIWLLDNQKLSDRDKNTIDKVLKTWLQVMWERGPNEELDEGNWEEVHATFTFGIYQIKAMVLFIKKRST